MKIICTQDNLVRGLNIVSNIAGKNVTLPILNNILLTVKDGSLILTSTNLDIGIKSIIRGSVESDGELTVQAKLLSDYISLLQGGNIELEKKDSDLIIRAGKQETVIKGIEAEEFPIVPDVSDIKGVKLEAKDLKDTLSQVIFAASYEEIRPELSGVYFSVTDEDLTLVATDSYRLAEKKVKIGKEGKEIGNINKIIPLRVLQEIVRIIGEGENKIEVGFSDNQVVFRFKESVVVSRLIEGNYPDYNEIIPKESKTNVVIDRVELIKAVKAASLFSKSGINDILLDFNTKENEILISAINVQLGESKASMAVEIKGENNSVVFNFKYLLDGLQNLSGKKIKAELTSGDSPVVLRPESGDYLYLIMPIRR
jgi:DNA polymerase III subunit beta